MTPTREQLDAAVLAAADELESAFVESPKHGNGGWVRYDGGPAVALCAAVRARREAMRPHKAALLSQWVRYRKSGQTPMEHWESLDELTRDEYRGYLADLLAAPDEPQEGKP